MADHLDLPAIRARAEKATKGPWGAFTAALKKSGRREAFVQREAADGEFDEIICTVLGVPLEQAKSDAAFIAHAREDVPALCDEVERLRKALKAILYRLDERGPDDYFREGTDLGVAIDSARPLVPDYKGPTP